MSRQPRPEDYVTEIDPSLSREDGPLQVLRSPRREKDGTS